jgi:hypothetical protein
MRIETKVIAKALEVLIEMKDADGCLLGSRGNCQIGQRVSMSAV